MSLEFYYKSLPVKCGIGNASSCVPKSVYRDAPKGQILEILEAMKVGKHWRKAVEDIVYPTNPWLAKIILHSSRRDFFSLIVPEEEDFLALDIGAGWGQHTLELAKHGTVCSLEPSPERFQFIRESSLQDGVDENIYFMNYNLQDLDFETKFDFALCIGVLEWVGKFEKSGRTVFEVQKDFLSKIKSALKPGSKLIVGIENRLGLKYLLGSNDDHLGKAHVACLDFESADALWRSQEGESLRVATYTIEEYENLFGESGFENVEFYAALPDYKVPEIILPCHPIDQLSSYFSQGGFVPEHDGANGEDCGLNPQLKSLYKTLGNMNTSAQFAPSFYIVAENNR